MNPAVTRFLSFLTHYRKFNEPKLSNLARQEIATLERFLSYSEEEWVNHLEIFNNYKELSKYLLLSPLSRQERAEVVFFLYSRNSLLIEDHDIWFFDFHKISDTNGNSILTQKLLDMVQSEKFSKFLQMNEKDLTRKQKQQRKEILDFVKRERINPDGLIQNICSVKEHYLDKMFSYDEEDIKVVVRALQENSVSPSLVSSIQKFLKDDLARRRWKSNQVGLKKEPVQMSSISCRSPLVLKQTSPLQGYFDWENMQPKRMLTFEEVIWCVSYLLKQGKTKEEIQAFLKVVFPGWVLTSRHPILWYFQVVEKLQFYQDDVTVESSLRQLESYFQEIFLCSDEDYAFWNEEISNELQRCQTYLSDRYDYEIAVATRALEKEEE